MRDYSREDNLRDADAAAALFVALDTLPVPLVGRIQGAALGGGAGLAAVCDVVVAADDAVFGFTEVRLGILPAVMPAVRARMGEAAVAAARAAGYVNAGTIEFLLEGASDDARFYFLEMNTRLQVEHAITEAITGVDLVHAQLAVAAGAPLPWTQESLAPRGHAIEVRLCAEDPEQGFLPQAGRLLTCRFPQAPGLRIDAGVERGDAIPVQYDSLVAKLVAHASTRDAAIARLSAALRRTLVFGVRTNATLLARILAHPRFAAGDVDTGFVADEHEALLGASPASAACAAAAWVRTRAPGTSPGASPGDAPGGVLGPAAGSADSAIATSPWTALRGWRG